MLEIISKGQAVSNMTWQFLPRWLLGPALAGVISLDEAARMWDVALLTTEPILEVPDNLIPAYDRVLDFLERNPMSEAVELPLH